MKKEEFKHMTVLVIGDSGEDVFQYGTITRLCPEAPVPVFNPTIKTSNPGMSGNVVANLKALGANVIHITNSTQITKTRLVDENDKVKNIDTDKVFKIRYNTYNDIHIDAIIVSDYDKGFLNEDDIEMICSYNSNVFIDTKKIIDKWATKASFLKINHVEFEKTEYTLKDLDLKDKLIITLSDKGCRYKDQIFPVEKVKIKDVSGAGDTFISGLVLEWLRTGEVDLAIKFAQECATVVVQKQGVVTI